MVNILKSWWWKPWASESNEHSSKRTLHTLMVVQ